MSHRPPCCANGNVPEGLASLSFRDLPFPFPGMGGVEENGGTVHLEAEDYPLTIHERGMEIKEV